MDKPIVCFFNSSKTWGGGEKWHLETALAFKEFSMPIIVSNPNSELIKKAKYHKLENFSIEINNFSFLNPFSIKKLTAYFKHNRIDSIIMNLPADLKLAAPIAYKIGINKVIYRRGSAIPIKNNWLNRNIFSKYIDFVIANSEATKNTILQNGNLIPIEKIYVIPNWIENNINSQFKKINKKIIIGNSGRFVEQKNQIDLLLIALELKKRNIDFEIRIAGEGKLFTKIKDEALKLGLKNEIVFLGFLNNMNDFYNNIDIFILTSKWEGFGYVIAESFLHSKPVLAYNLSSNPELIINGENGYLFDFGDIQSISDTIIKLNNNPNLILELGQNGRNFIVEKYSKEKILPKLRQLII